MSNHLREDRIQDYVDDLLCREERMDAEQHLLICAVCQAEVAAVRDLVADLHAVPESIAPDRDLLGGINTRIDALQAAQHQLLAVPLSPRLRERTLWSMRVPLAAAAIVLIAISVTTTKMLSRNAARNANGTDNVAGATDNGGQIERVSQNGTASEQTTLDKRYAAATRELESLLRAQQSQLAPETRRLVEENLRVIDHALVEARDALRSDPNNAALTDLMRSAYEKKLDLLRHATQIRGES